MTLSVTWKGRDDEQTYLVGEPGTKVTFSLDEEAARELDFQTGSAGSPPVVLVVTRTGGGKSVTESVAWPPTNGHFVSLDYSLQASQIVQYQARLGAPYADCGMAADGQPLRFTFIPKQRSNFSRAFLLASLAALALFFAPLLTRLAGDLRHDLLFAWGTPLVAALVAFLRTELLNTRRPPLLGILLYPRRTAIAVVCAWSVAALFALFSVTAVTNATPSAIVLADGATQVPIAAGETVVFMLPAPRAGAFWDRALGKDDKRHCLASPSWPKDCKPHPGADAPARFRLAQNVVIQCKGERWDGWKETDAASFQHALKSLDGVWVEPGADCKPREDEATVTFTQTDSSATSEVTAKYPWQRSTQTVEAKLVLELEDRRQTANVVSRSFKVSQDTVCPAQSGGTYGVLLTSSTGQKQELGVLKCAPQATCIRKIPFKLAALSELTLEQNRSQEWLSTWTVDAAGRGTQTTGFVCVPQAGASAFRLVVTVATAQEPSDLELDAALDVQTLEVRSAFSGAIATIGEGTCAGLPSATWHRWQLGDSSDPGLLQMAKLNNGKDSSALSEWRRSPTLSSSAGLGFRSAWLCGNSWSFGEANGKKTEPPKAWQLVVPTQQETVCQLSEASGFCPADFKPTHCGTKKRGSDAGHSECDWVQICQCERR